MLINPALICRDSKENLAFPKKDQGNSGRYLPSADGRSAPGGWIRTELPLITAFDRVWVSGESIVVEAKDACGNAISPRQYSGLCGG